MFQTTKNVGWGLTAGWQKVVGEAWRMRSQCSVYCFKLSVSMAVRLTDYIFFPHSGPRLSHHFHHSGLQPDFFYLSTSPSDWKAAVTPSCWKKSQVLTKCDFKKPKQNRAFEFTLCASKRRSVWAIICLDFRWNADIIWWRWNIVSC